MLECVYITHFAWKLTCLDTSVSHGDKGKIYFMFIDGQNIATK